MKMVRIRSGKQHLYIDMTCRISEPTGCAHNLITYNTSLWEIKNKFFFLNQKHTNESCNSILGYC